MLISPASDHRQNTSQISEKLRLQRLIYKPIDPNTLLRSRTKHLQTPPDNGERPFVTPHLQYEGRKSLMSEECLELMQNKERILRHRSTERKQSISLMRMTGERVLDKTMVSPSEKATAVSSFVVAYANQATSRGRKANRTQFYKTFNKGGG